MQGYMLDKLYIGRTPHLYYNKLRWVSKLGELSLEGSGVGTSGASQEPWIDTPGMFHWEGSYCCLHVRTIDIV